MTTMDKVGNWVAANKGLAICSITAIGLVSWFSLKLMSLPAIPIRIIGNVPVKVNGGGIYTYDTAYIRDGVPSSAYHQA